MHKDLAADGLRGVAALSVLFAHFILTFMPAGLARTFAWVASDTAIHGHLERFLAIPILSSLWNGRFAVCIFFILSGYVLTMAFHRTGRIEVIRSLAARRYFRLGIPIFASVMFAYLLCVLGAFDTARVAALTGSSWLVSQSPPTDPSLLDAIKDGVYGVIFNGSTRFNGVFWTMRIEFIGSMLIFAYALLSGPTSRTWIFPLIYAACVIFFAPREWPFYLAFLIGSHLNAPIPKAPAWLTSVGIVLAMYLAGFDGSPLYAPLRVLVPDDALAAALWGTLGGAIAVLAVRAGAFRAVLTGKTSQFLGRISYPLYLLHAPIIMTVGCGVYLSMYGHGPRVLSIGVTFVASVAAIVLVAALFERWVDQPAIRFGKWLLGRGRQDAMAADRAP